MAAPRLPFLWPMLFKTTAAPAHACAPLASRSSHCRNTRSSRRRHLATTSYRAQAAPIQRYGKAFEPAPHLRPDIEESKETTLQIAPVEPRAQEAEEEEEEHTPTATAAPSTPSKSSVVDDTPLYAPPDPPKTGEAKPLDSVLHMPSPADSELHKPPHLKTPPYVHHFDTYGLVKQLTKSTYTEAQSVTMMKAVRGVLIENMMLAREGLVSKSNVENETYLFSAACAELRTEVGNLRKAEIERMRTERDQLQHEVDILGQKLGQETGTIKDELKGLFDDRKMAVRQEQRVMETKIQELNYQITIKLNSDARSEVEGLRWVLTRRIAMGISAMAFMLIVLLQFNSSRNHAHEKEKKKAMQTPPSDNHPPPPPPVMVDASSQVNQQEALGGELLATEGVSLG